MTNASATNLLEAYKLAITKKETTIADLLEKVIISEIHRDIFIYDSKQYPQQPFPILTGPTCIESSTKVTADVLHTT